MTGLSAITPIGIGKEAFWNSLMEGKSGIGLITQFDTTDFNCKIAGEVKDFDFADYGDKKEGKRMDRVTQFAVACAKMAVKDSALDLDKEDADRIGVCVGTGIGGIHTFLDAATKLVSKGPGRISPFFIPMEIPNMPAAQIAIDLKVKGPNTAIVTACSTGSDCIGDALRTIQYGDADVMLAGGTEAAISPIAVAGFDNMKALSRNNEAPEKASCPFDKKRSGFVMGEGAGIVVLEELEHAKARGAQIYAELVGYGHNSDAYHITAPDPEGDMQVKCMEMAIKDAGLTPADIDYVNAHGTATPNNDASESRAMIRLFGDKIPPVSSTKAFTGHTTSAAGSIEAVICLLAIRHGFIPANLNWKEPFDGGVVPDAEGHQGVRLDHVLCNSFGFGGNDSSLLISRYGK